jgi:hypothetical protein
MQSNDWIKSMRFEIIIWDISEWISSLAYSTYSSQSDWSVG